MYPDDLKYTAEHEWTRDEGSTVVIGITSFAQEALGDIVYVQLPAAGTAIHAGATDGNRKTDPDPKTKTFGMK